MKLKKKIGWFGLFIVLIFLIVIMPIAVIWSLNTLFNLSIAYTFKTWLSVIILNMMFYGKFKR